MLRFEFIDEAGDINNGSHKLLDWLGSFIEQFFDFDSFLKHGTKEDEVEIDNGEEDESCYDFPLFEPPVLPNGDQMPIIPVSVEEKEHLEWLAEFIDYCLSEPYRNPIRAAKVSSPSSAPPAAQQNTKALNFLSPSPPPSEQLSKCPDPDSFTASSNTKPTTPLPNSSVSSVTSPPNSPSTPTSFNFHRCSLNKKRTRKSAMQERRRWKNKATRKVANMPRKCSHCGVQKTPQWRAGPDGSKTLCNACGVRFKSGRLLPEYRPACSPSFSSEVHSNSHRKVMEMRRRNEEMMGLQIKVEAC